MAKTIPGQGATILPFPPHLVLEASARAAWREMQTAPDDEGIRAAAARLREIGAAAWPATTHARPIARTAAVLAFPAVFKAPEERRVDRLVDAMERMLANPETPAEQRFAEAMHRKLARHEPDGDA